MKKIENLWTNPNNTYISIESYFVSDPAGNQVIEINQTHPLKAQMFLNDMERPALDSFDLDVDEGVLTLHFSETVNVSSFDFESFTLQSHYSTFVYTQAKQHVLLNGEFQSIGDVADVIIQLSREDRNLLKKLIIANTRERTYLILADSAVLDQTGNKNIPRFDHLSSLLVSNYTPDSSSPKLQSFNLNLTSDILTLEFDETVDVSTFNASFITLFTYDLMVNYTLSDESILSGDATDGPIIQIYLSEDDRNNIKRLEDLAVGNDSTFISITSDTISDMFGYRVNPVSPSDEFSVDIFVMDALDPSPVSFDLDLTAETLIIYFTETVDVTTFDVTQVTLTDPVSDTNYTLQYSTVDHDDEPYIIIKLNRTDLNKIKEITTLGTNASDTYLSLTSSTIQDMNGNYLSDESVDNPLKVRSYKRDFVPPVLEAFDLDLDSFALTLYFSETVNTLTLDPTSIVFQDNSTATHYYQLTGGFTETDNSSVVIVNLTVYDVDWIKHNFELATGPSKTYLTINSTLIEDMFGNAVVNISDGNGLKVNEYNRDVTPPYLTDFSLDMNTAILELTFSEVVNAQSFNIKEVKLQSSKNNSDLFEIYQLSGGNSSMENSTLISVNLTFTDQTEIKKRYLLASSEINTYLVHTDGLVSDMEQLAVVSIVNGEAKQVQNFTEDTTPPEIISWDIDMNEGFMDLTFDETVNRTSLDLMEVSLQDYEHPLTASHQLEGGHTDDSTKFLIGNTVTQDNTVIRVTFDIHDLNEIKRKTLCTDVEQEGDCYLSFTNASILDMNNNEVVPRESDNAIRVEKYIEDDTRPKLVDFTLFNLSSELLTLEFDETVNISSFDTTEISLWNYYVYSPAIIYVNLTGPIELITKQDSTFVSFKPLDYDLNRIKQHLALCTQDDVPHDCYVQVSDDLVLDMAMNPVEAVRYSPDHDIGIVRDRVNPTLVGFAFDLDRGRLYLTFDETVDRETFDPTGLTFYNDNDNMTEMVTLTGGTEAFNSENWLYIEFDLDPNDIISLKYMEYLATNLSDTFLLVDSKMIKDMNENPVELITEALPLQAGNYSFDVTEPKLEGFSLDFHYEEQINYLYLTFDEPVRVNTTDLTLITFHWTSPDIDIDDLTLTGGIVEYDPSVVTKLVLRVDMSYRDLRQIDIRYKYINDILSDEESVVLSISAKYGMVYDMNDNPMTEVKTNESIIITNRNPDRFRPDLLYYDLDMDVGTITLHYDKVIDQERLVPTELTIHNSSNPIQSHKYVLTGGKTNTPDEYYTILEFSIDDFNNLKRDESLLTDENDTFITFTRDFIDDTRGLNIKQKLVSGVQVREFTPDTSHPMLTNYTLDMDDGILYLTFNETVKSNTLNRTLITFLSIANATLLENTTMYENDSSLLHYTLTGDGMHSYYYDDTVVNVTFSKHDWDELKRLYGLAISQETTFLAFPKELIDDMNENSIVPIPTTDARMVQTFIPDTTHPYLISWELDIDDGTLVLHFPETMDSSSFNVTELRIQSSSISDIGFNLRGGAHSPADALDIKVWITKEDLDEIKRIEEIATSVTDSYLSFGDQLVHDMNFNRILPRNTSNGIRVEDFNEDTTQPYLVLFLLDMDSDLLILSFSETMDASTVNYISFTLLNAPNVTDYESYYTLTGGNLTMDDSTMLNLTFSKTDSDEIRRLFELAISDDTTYLSLLETAIDDMHSNPITLINTTYPIKVTNFTEDTTSPQLISYDLDMNTNMLFLTFSETVDLDTFDLQEIKFSSVSNETDETEEIHIHQLQDADYTMDNSTMITLNISHEDMNQIKRLYLLATANFSTYLSITDQLIMDMNDNNVTEIPEEDALPVNIYIPDVTPPQLSYFVLNMTSEKLTLYFSETVNTTSLRVEQITLQPKENFSRYDPIHSFSPEITVSYTDFNDVLVVEIGLEDMNRLKQLRNLTEGLNNTFISITNITILDMNDNNVIRIPPHLAQHVSVFYPDQTAPRLEAFSLDMNTGTLLLNFTETIDILSLNISEILLQPMQHTPDEDYKFIHQLRHGNPPRLSSTQSSDYHIIRVDIGEDDLNEIKRIKELAREINTTYISFSESFVSDMFGNPIVALPNGMAQKASAYEEDVTGPLLRSFTLNLTSEKLVLTFDETVDTSTISITNITLLSELENDGSGIPLNILSGSGSGEPMSDEYRIHSYTLMDFISITDIDGPIVIINLTDDDLHNIKLMTNLASNPNNTYLQLLEQAFLDNALEPNYNQKITLKVVKEDYGFDKVAPKLNSFSVDMNKGIIALSFDEPVDRSTLNTTGLILLGNDTTYSMKQVQRLTGGESSSISGLEIILQIAENDFNDLKENTRIFSSIETSFLAVDPFFIKDMAGNPIEAIIDGDALQASDYQNDTIMPELTGFSLDMNTGTFNLTFSETVNVASLDLQQLTFQRFGSVANDFYKHTLTGGKLLSTMNDTEILIQLLDRDLNELKTRMIGRSNTSVYITFPSSTILDMNHRMVKPQLNGKSPFPVDRYLADITTPRLLNYTLNLTSGAIELTFSESVYLQTPLDPTQLTFQDSFRRTTDKQGLRYFVLSEESNSSSPNEAEITINLSLDDLNALKERRTLATQINNTFLTITNDFISDTFGNPIDNIGSKSGLQALYVYEDTTRPELDNYKLDLKNEILTLYFSETVDSETIDITSISIYETSDGYGDFYDLTGGIIVSPPSAVISIQLSTADLNTIKEKFTLAVDEQSTYLSLAGTTVRDMSGLYVVPITADKGKPPLMYTEDSVNPELVSFDLDLDAGPGVLELTFDETINAETLNPHKITLRNRDNTVNYTLQNSTQTIENSTVVKVYLSEQDSNRIKYYWMLATNNGNTFLAYPSNVVLDMNNNEAVAEDAKQVDEVTPDDSSPVLRGFAFNLTAETLTLTFSETVRASTLDPKQITLLGSNSGPSQNYTLTGGESTSVNSTVVRINLTFHDLNQLKILTSLVTSPNNSFISITNDLVVDMNGNKVSDVPTTNPLPVTAEYYTADKTRPVLEDLTVDLDRGLIILTFDETVAVTGFNTTQFTFVDCCSNVESDTSGSGESSASESGDILASGSGSGSGDDIDEPVIGLTTKMFYQYTLTGGMCESSSDTVFTCYLSVFDLNELKKLPICSNDSNCCLTFTGDAVLDHAGNELETVFDECGVETTFKQDKNRPSLVSFDVFNLNQHTFTLTFNETIDVSTINMTHIRLQSFYHNSTLPLLFDWRRGSLH